MSFVHHRTELRLEHLHEAVALSRAELLEERARLADLPRQCVREHAVLWAEVLLEKLREHALVVHEGGQPLAHLAVLGIEELREHGGDRALLLLDVRAELPVDVVHERRADVLELRLLRLRVGIAERVLAADRQSSRSSSVVKPRGRL